MQNAERDSTRLIALFLTFCAGWLLLGAALAGTIEGERHAAGITAPIHQE